MSIEPSQPETAWHEKARDAERVFSNQGPNTHDCRSIRIEVQPEGNALLTFTTTDGRIAVRLLHSPEDIAPTVEALLVTLPVETPLEIPAPKTNAKTSPAPSAQPQSRERPAKTSVLPRPTPRLLFNAFTGGRFGIKTGVFAPIVGLYATMLFEPWELGIGGEWNPLYVPLVDSAPSGYSMQSFEGNLVFGRRIVRGSRAFHGGMLLGVAIVHEEMDADPAEKGRVNIDAFQPRIGLYGGIIHPYDATLRFRLGLQTDMALWGVRAGGTAKRNLPDLPRFGLGICLGMEVAP